MATDAPYYQKRTSQARVDFSSSVADTETGMPGNTEYRPTSIANTKQSNTDHHLQFYPQSGTRQSAADKQQKDSGRNDALGGLLEAATTAVTQDFTPMLPRETALVVPDPCSKRMKSNSTHQIDMTASAEDPSQEYEEIVAKRRRIDKVSTEPNFDISDGDTVMPPPAFKSSHSPSRDDLLIGARAAGVHSAAALFRRSSSKTTRKYTRPPMSKLFMSLNITPENFIALQALAKTYMLSPAHPERQSCVGNRGKGDTDMVKLRLFNCVKDFLSDGGVGEKFFGEHAEKPGEKESHEAAAALGEKEGGGEGLVWPRDGNKIISLVTPLMRRMVTNERQRLYAIDSRKSGKKLETETGTESLAEDPVQNSSPSTPVPDAELQLQVVLDPILQRSTDVQTPSSSPKVVTTSGAVNEDANCTRSTVITSPVASLAPLSTNTAEPHLTNINIFLTYVSSTSKSAKVDEKRISTTHPAHLTFYNYAVFLDQVDSMIAQAKLTWSSIKLAPAMQESESLRGLAAAANALQPDKDEQQVQQAPDFVPRYIVKTIGSLGWQIIDSAETWYHILTERAFATWADGVCNIIVELDIDHIQSAERTAREGV
ncbi:hypothetical protein E8E13_006363 [Curvularia kusanoi]|uniref:Uncharacterized protein n=1 Tax=Curvularia kusanoi TaxID=90978 RepID=A0A9P4WC83_CURKU|nr:hypothetical protein E8E13_006363 [Curvularia kusanoi]